MPAPSVCGEHCNGEFMHCSGPCCHGKAAAEAKANPDCGIHCIGYRDPETGELTAENSRNHCRCKDCHNLQDIDLHRHDPSISFHGSEKKPTNA